MTSKAWAGKIRQQMQAAGMYRKEFGSVISALAKVLELRDAAYQQFEEEGRQLVISKTSDRGAVNQAKNPLLQIWADMNMAALAYWRDLGLTPAGLKKIDENSMKRKKRSHLDEALSRAERE